MFSFLIKRNFANAYKHVYNSLSVTLFGWVRGKVGLTEQWAEHSEHMYNVYITQYSVYTKQFIYTLSHYYIPNHGQMLHEYVVYGTNERICEWLSLNYSAFKCTTYDIKKCCFFSLHRSLLLFFIRYPSSKWWYIQV